MSAHLAFHAPIGSIIAWSDGTPRPPERHTKKLVAWRSANSQGRLISRCGGRTMGNLSFSPSFILHESDYGAGGVITLRVHRGFSVDSKLSFTIVERPAIGSARVFGRAGDGAELVHLAVNRAAAEEWLSRHGYRGAVIDEVTADEFAGTFAEGRAA